jgi:site-specific DNA-methyltransferase (adenine-specific)
VTPYYADDLVTIYYGDSAEIMASMSSDAVGLVLTDPPFNARVKYGVYDDNRPWAEYTGWLIPLIEEMERVSRGRVLMFSSVPAMLRLVADKRPKWMASWNRPVSNNHPAGNSGFMSRWEPVLVYGRTFGADGRVPLIHMSDSWTAMPTNATNGHPCPKPVELIRTMLAQHPTILALGSAPTNWVLDPFMGSGTTLVAAKSLGRHAIGIEIEERYCEIAANRCRQEVLGLLA